ncbi:MAG: hypothetical protein M1600_01290 [Firmicutes bacterium]|nr:hypothetical protein [Bacillota bacterium]
MALDTYSQLRDSAKQLYAALLEHASQDLVLQAGRLLGIVQRGTLALESEQDGTFLMDALVHEPIDGVASLVTQALRDHWSTGVLNQVQLLSSMENAYTSLFTVETTRPDLAKLTLRDQFDSAHPELVLTDFYLSQSVSPGTLLFTRILTFDDIAMTSGIGMPFAADLDRYLRRRLKPMEHKIHSTIPSVQRYAAFFRLYRTDGVPMAFGDPPAI